MCSIVVSDNGLHALSESHNYHDKKGEHTIDDTVGSDSHVATVVSQAIVEYNDYYTGAYVHQER